MIRLVCRSIFNQKGIFTFFIVGMMLVCTILPLATVSLREAMVQIEDDITEHGRGSYDILVRPKGARTDIERELGIVEENYLTVGEGGITIAEWESIRDREDVEIAAPVASLGYFSGERQTFATWMPDESVRVRSKLFTSDGVHEYPIEPDIDSVGILIEQHSVPQIVPRFDFLSKNDAFFGQWDPPMFMLPSTFHLLVGIDPDSERQITSISFQALKEDIEDPFVEQYANGAEVIKVMRLLDPNLPVKAEIEWETLDITKEQTAKWKEDLNIAYDEPISFGEQQKVEQLFNELLEYPSLSRQTFEADFKSFMTPFSYERFVIDENYQVMNEEGSTYVWTDATSQFFSTLPIDYDFKSNHDIVTVRKKGKHKGVPVYREIEQKSGDYQYYLEKGEDPPFYIHPEGAYRIKPFQDDLSASPLGIYQMAPIMLLKDEDGNVLDEPVEVYPTIFPGSFAPTPAQGVIHIKDTKTIKGNAPIDAIRIRVAGLDGYDEQAQEKIENIAMDLLEHGYEVDIVAGASYQHMDVYVEGLGTISQPWTTLGAAATLIDSWSGTTVLLSVMFSLIALLYLWNRLYYYRKRKTAEVRLLTQLGWETNKIKRLNRLELSFLFIMAWLLSLLGIWVAYRSMDMDGIKQLLYWNGGFAVVGVMFVLGASEWRWGNFFEETQKKSHATNGQRHQKEPTPSSLTTLAFKSMFYFKSYIASTFFQIILVGSLSIVVFLALHATVEQTNVTMLGEYMNFNLNTLHFVMLGSAYVLGGITLIESLFSLFEFRKDEVTILRSIGWKFKHIFFHWLRELAIWSSLAVILGHGIGLIVYIVYYPFQISQLVTVLYSITVMFILIICMGAIILYRFLRRSIF